MEEGKIRYGISQKDFLEVANSYEGLPWACTDRFDIADYERQRDAIMAAGRLCGDKGPVAIQEPYEGGVVIGGCLFRVPLKSRVFTIDTRIAKLRPPTFDVEPGYSVVDVIAADPLERYSKAQREQILAWLEGDFKASAEQHGLRYFPEGILMTETMTEVPAEELKKKLQKSLEDITDVTEIIQSKAKQHADKQQVA
jgi:hypothetical protein